MVSDKVIKPLRNRCSCGNKVKNHHFLCDSCYSKKDRIRNKKRSKKILDDFIKSKKIKRR
jgi:hypothetical protein